MIFTVQSLDVRNIGQVIRLQLEDEIITGTLEALVDNVAKPETRVLVIAGQEIELPVQANIEIFRDAVLSQLTRLVRQLEAHGGLLAETEPAPSESQLMEAAEANS